MSILVAIALLLISGAVALLYAMMGELASRVADSDATLAIRPLTDYRQGEKPDVWPEGLAGVRDSTQATVLVLSPICSTCNRVAAEIGELPASELDNVGLVISCASRESGEGFVVRNNIEHLPKVIDVGGEWVSRTFGVRTSPTALVLESGALESAYSFSAFKGLRAEIAHQARNQRGEHV